jgi:hypothetical protein
MNPKTLLILAGVTVAVGIGAYVASRPASKPTLPGTAERTPFFPELKGVLAGVTAIEIKDATKSVTIRRADPNSPWTLAEKSDFPVGEKVQPLLASLTGMEILEPKTSRAEFFGQIGVADPDKPGSTAKQVTLKDSGGKAVAAVLVGNSGSAGDPQFGGGDNSSLFVRKTGGEQAFLVTGPVVADTDPMSWIERQVAQIDRNSIKSYAVTRHDDPGFVAGDPVKSNVLEAFRDTAKDVNFKVRNMPSGRELAYEGAADQPTTPLGALYIDDVKPRVAIDFEKTEAPGPVKPAGGKAGFARTTARYVMFDGMVVTARMTKQDGKVWLTLNAAYDEKEAPAAPPPPTDTKEGEKPADPTTPTPKPEDVKKGVEAFNAKHAAWAYGVADYVGTQIGARLEEMLKPPPAPSTPGPEPAGPNPPTVPDSILVPENPR